MWAGPLAPPPGEALADQGGTMKAVHALWLAASLTIAMTSVGPRPAEAAEPGGIEGLWQGTLQGMLRLVVHVERGPAGGLTATLDSPDQGAMGLAIDTLVATADSMRFDMRRI